MNTFSKLFIIVSLVAGNSFAAPPPNAAGPATGELKFNGQIVETCNLQQFVDGTIVANSNQTTMSSTESGGAPAQVNIRANANNYSLVLGSAHLYDSKNNELTDISVTLNPVGTGTDLIGTIKGNFSATKGVMNFDSGLYNISVDGSVTRNNGAFEAGTYVLRVPVSCVKAS